MGERLGIENIECLGLEVEDVQGSGVDAENISGLGIWVQDFGYGVWGEGLGLPLLQTNTEPEMRSLLHLRFRSSHESFLR